jgi:hypothetical protein
MSCPACSLKFCHRTRRSCSFRQGFGQADSVEQQACRTDPSPYNMQGGNLVVQILESVLEEVCVPCLGQCISCELVQTHQEVPLICPFRLLAMQVYDTAEC